MRVFAVAVWLGGFGARFLVMLFFVGLLGYWLFVTIWLPLAAIRPLPVDVTEENPAVDIDVLRQISLQRMERLEHKSDPLVIRGVITSTDLQE